MAMGKRKKDQQASLFVTHDELPRTQGHPFYQRLNEIFAEECFDGYVEKACEPFYAKVMGRPGVPPGVYFRMFFVGYFEGIDSERGIAWRCADSLSLRDFLGYGLSEKVPDHSSLSRTRRLIDVETHQEVFTWVLKVLGKSGLVKGKTVGIDATTLEANAALRSIVNRATNESYEDFLERLAKESGIETPTKPDIAKLDRKRKGKGSNKEWAHPHDPDARITKMKDGRTHLAHKMETAVDMETGVLLAVTVQDAVKGDTRSLIETMEASVDQMQALNEDPETQDCGVEASSEEIVLDKGYHSNETLMFLSHDMQLRTYVSEPDRGPRKWKGKEEARDAVYANRRRIRGERGKKLLRRRGEFLERPFAHCLETGGMRRTHLRYHDNILKRLLVHTAGFNLSQLMRRTTGIGKPRCLQGYLEAILAKRTLTGGRKKTVAKVCMLTGFKLLKKIGQILFSRSPNSNSGFWLNPSFTTGC